jgi:hypothetical protein
VLVAAAEWLRCIGHDRMRKPSTISTYRSLLGSRIPPAFGSMPIESVTSEMIESWIASVDRTAATRIKLLAMLHGIFQRARKVWGLKVNLRKVRSVPLVPDVGEALAELAAREVSTGDADLVFIGRTATSTAPRRAAPPV